MSNSDINSVTGMSAKYAFNDGKSSAKVNLRETARRVERNSVSLRRVVSSIGRTVDAWAPTCICCGAMAMVAGAALFANIPVIATTAVLAAAGCAWFMINSDYSPVRLIGQHAIYGAASAALAIPASIIAGPAGAMVAGGVVLGAGLVGKFVDYMANTR